MGRKLIGIVASVGGGEVSEAGGGWTGEERRIVHLSSTQRHPTPPNATQRHPTPARLWWSLRPCQRVKQRLLARNLFSASATPRQPVSPRQPFGPNMGLARITRSPLNRLKANAELVRTAFFWKLLVEDLGQSGWLSNKKPISRNSCLSPPAQAFDNNFLFKSLITCVHL